MSYAVVLVILGIIFVYGGIKGYSITHLLQGQLVPRTPPAPPGNNPSGPNPGGAVVSGTSAYSSPISSGAKFERIDQGVDYQQSGSYTALGSGIVTKIATGWAGGTGQAVYIKLDNPITIGNQTYDGYYYAETTPLVRLNQKVNVGQPIASGGSAEIGFLVNGEPTPLQGGLGASTKPTQAGNDFYSLVNQLLKR